MVLFKFKARFGGKWESFEMKDHWNVRFVSKTRKMMQQRSMLFVWECFLGLNERSVGIFELKKRVFGTFVHEIKCFQHFLQNKLLFDRFIRKITDLWNLYLLN